MTRKNLQRTDALSLRVLSAAVMVPAGLAVVWFGGFALLIAGVICASIMWSELWSVTTKRGFYLSGVFGGVLLISAIVGAHYFPENVYAMAGALLFAMSILSVASRLSQTFWIIGGAALVFCAVVGLLQLRGTNDGRLFLTIVVMVAVWVTDIAAYFAGRGFGGPQLAPRNSPNKTWSGAAGAVICTALLGAVAAGLIGGNPVIWIIYAASVSAIAQLGDLGQSKWKRNFGVKDSGTIIPGHGGVLDRLDSFSAVLVAHALALSIDPLFPEHVLGLGV